MCVQWRRPRNSDVLIASTPWMRWARAADRRRSISPSSVGAWESGLVRHCPNEAFHLGLVVVVVRAGADERVQSARGQIECGRAWRAGHVDVDVQRGEALARLARRFAVLQEGDDPALLHA